jgi:hypothetical protein
MSQRGTIVYVHGASDRGPQVDDHVAQIERQILLAGMDFDVVASRWGEAEGARLDRLEAALPAAAPPTVPAAVPRGDASAARAPLAELAELAQSAGSANTTSRQDGARLREADQLLAICRSQIVSAEATVTAGSGPATSLAVACSRAASEIGESVEYTQARASGVAEAALIDAVGRAVAVSVAVNPTMAAKSTVTANLFDDAQMRIAEAVVGVAAATLLAGYLGVDVGPHLKRWATDVLIPHRARITRDVALGPADVVLYQRNGERIRRFVARTIGEALRGGGPVVALGNSLGGVVLVDTLSQPGAPRPHLLVTAGSQAPLLATFGGLDPLGLPGSPPPFQPWLNIFDRRDFLGFVARPVWPGEAGIIDREVDMGLGFPDSHGVAYLRHSETYLAIAEQLDSASGGLPGGGATTAVPRRFPIRLGARSWPILRLFGARPENSYVDLNGGLDAHFGFFAIRVPLSNVTSWRIEGPWRWLTAIGVRRSVRHGDVTFGGNHAGGVRLNFREPVKWGPFQVPALYVTVADMEGLGAALAERGIHGEDARRRPL